MQIPIISTLPNIFYIPFYLQNHEVLLGGYLLAVVATECQRMFANEVKTCWNGLVIRYALRVEAAYVANNFVWYFNYAFLNHFVVSDDVEFRFGRYEGNFVYLIVGKKLVGNFDDALATEFVALEVRAKSYLVRNILETEKRYYLEKVLCWYMVYYGAVFYGTNFQFFLHDAYLFYTQNRCYDCHTCIHTILGLLEVVSFRIGIYVGIYLAHAWQWM